MHRLLRISACAAVLAGLLWLIAQAIPHVPGSAKLELLYAAVDLAFLVALTGLIAQTAPQIRTPGLVLLLIALGSVASIVGPDAKAFGVDFYLAGSALFTIALGLSAPFLASLPGLKPAAAAWMLAALTGLASALGGGSTLVLGAGFLLAVGFVLIAPPLWRAAG
jgi:hypothetical protein